MFLKSAYGGQERRFIEDVRRYRSKTGGTPSVSTWATGLTSTPYGGAVLGLNNKIYSFPAEGTTVAVIDPAAQTTSTIAIPGETNDPGAFKWLSGVQAPNGFIYAPPFNFTDKVLKIDPENNTASTFGNLTLTEGICIGAVLADNNKIYGVPASNTYAIEIDLTTDTITSFGSFSSSSLKWQGGIQAPNGFIYCFPRRATTVLKINPSNRATSAFGDLSSFGNNTVDKWLGGTLAPNGMIYCAPFGSGSVLKINPTNDTVSTFGSGLGNYGGAILAPNGKIYCPPAGAGNVLEIDPTNDTTSTIGSGLGAYSGRGVLHPNGNIYSGPIPTTGLSLTIDVGVGSADPILLSSYLNNSW